MKLHREQRLPGPFASPWLVIGGAVILGVIILAMTLRNLDRDGKQMATILQEKGASLIKALEAGARTGMRNPLGTEMRMQVLVEEMADQPDIFFIMVTDHSGRVLAHSEPEQQGEVVFSPEDMSQLEPAKDVSWRIMTKGDTRAFVVYRQFMPLQGREGWWGRVHGDSGDETELGGDPRDAGSNRAGNGGRGRGMGMGRMRHEEHEKGLMSFFSAPNMPPPIIYVGMDVAPFEQARKQDTRHSLVMAGMLLLLGLAGLISLIWAQNVRRSRRMLQDSQAFSAEIVASLPEGLVLIDDEGLVALVNGKAEEQLGVSFESVRGKRPEGVLPRAVTDALAVLSREGRMLETETECFIQGGACIPMSISGARVYAQGAAQDGAEGGQGHVADILILRDLREVRRLQQEVRRKEKLAAVGSLAAGVAHEIRNPLSSIKGYATYFGTRFPEGSEDRAAAGIMVQEVDRLNRVITDLIGFSRPSDLKRRETDVHDLAEHCMRLLGADAAAQGVSLSFRCADGLPHLHVDPDRLSQALLNICLNGMEAMAGGGVLGMVIDMEEEDFLRIRISDTGHGIPPEALVRIFDPYYTTKSQGTGLGLAIVHKIIEAHGGVIHVASRGEADDAHASANGGGAGTTFTILLPVEAGQDA
ncbi:ATP-binding protein [Desulfovibrio mangrovi]|uniref:ATP-binding protein n=1 Tax=Desulfovibrio mangrovi TaxID=2976983 RepID=UPI002247A01A|nr:ATP-binding protein [Desulfovibrio mangrovi]UZP66354.1 ATP-binding protein [Desulfovibrio mangrovi]